VRRAWLGLEIQAELKSARVKKGVLITGTYEDSPARKAGFESGDLLVELAGTPVSVRFSEQMPRFNRLVADLPIGHEVRAVVLRKGKRNTLTVIPEEREQVRHRTREIKEWGITVRNLSFVAAKEMKRRTKDGVLVTSVRPGGPCGTAKPNLQSRDVIVEAGGTPIRNVEDLRALTETVLKGKKTPVPVLTVFERKKMQYLTAVKVGLKEIRDPGLEVKKAWIPISTQVLTRSLAKQLGIPRRKGVRITQIYPHKSMEGSDLKVGDIITAVDGFPLEVSDLEDFEVFPTLIRQYKVGTTVELGVLRQGRDLKVPIKLVRAPKLAREMKRYEDKNFEFTARDVAFLDKATEGWAEDQKGALVSEIVPGGWAALGNLGVGDLILEINGNPVKNIASLRKEMKELAEEKPTAVVFLVLRGIHRIYSEVETKW